MLNFKDLSIKTKGAIFMTAGILAVSAVIAAAVFYFETTRIREAKISAATGVVKILAKNLEAPLAFSDAQAAADILASIRTDAAIDIAQVIDESGKLFVSVVGTGEFAGDPEAPLVGNESDHGPFFVAEPIILDGKNLGRVSLLIDARDLESSFGNLAWIVSGLAILIAAAASSLLYFFQARLLSPLLSLASGARKISETKNYSFRAEASGGDEVGTLVHAFNQMLSEIERRDSELIIANGSLESKVSARTKELKAEIANRKRIESALTREREILRQVVKNAPVAMAMLDTEMRYLAHSSRWLTDYNLESEIIGRDHFEVVSDSFREMRPNFERAQRGETLSSSEDKIGEEGLDARYLRWAMQPWFHSDGAQGGIIVVSLPIDDLVRSREEAFKSAERMRHFFANMSHEIRTPLNGILGFAELLKSTPLQPEQLEKIGILQSSGEILLVLINDILDFAKLDSKKMTLERRTFALKTMLLGVAALFKPLFDKKELALEVDIDPNLPTFLVGDEVRLRQILMNLLGNALKFTERGGVRLDVKLLEADAGRSIIKFRISDTGIGIAKETLGRIFEPFTQADGSITRRFGGTGLGLSICRELVQLMSGEMSVESQPGVGTSLTFSTVLESASNVTEITSVKSQEPAPKIEAASVNPLARILVAEDNAVNQKLIAALLKARGLDYVIVNNGNEVIRETTDSLFDLILMDIQMPGMGGIDASRIIRGDFRNPNRRTPIIALTAHAFEEDKRTCLNSGMDDFLAKPINTVELDAALARWLREGARRAGNEG